MDFPSALLIHFLSQEAIGGLPIGRLILLTKKVTFSDYTILLKF